MALQIKAAKLPPPVREYRFARGFTDPFTQQTKDRLWRFDFAWPDQKVALEIEGGAWVSGRHTRGAGFENDCEKYAAALLLGWKVIRVPTRWVRNLRALNTLEATLNDR